MPKRPILGRAGAGVLLAVAAVLANLVMQQSTAGQLVTHPAAHATQLAVDSAGSGLDTRPPATVSEQVQVVPLGRASLRVPIIMYHYIRINPNPRDTLGFNLSVTPDDFQKQMDLLRDRGYSPVNFGDLRAYWASEQPLPPKPVVLTFDDGYVDFYTTAYPILRQHGFKSVSYVVPGFLNGPNYMSMPQVQQLDAEGLVQVASHTVGHVDLTKASQGQLSFQLVESKKVLEQIVGHPVLDFCYPSGMYNSTVVAAVQAAGYQSATTTQPGYVHSMNDRFVWTRQRVSGGESLAAFANDLGAEEPTATIVRQVEVPSGGSAPRSAATQPASTRLLPFQLLP